MTRTHVHDYVRAPAPAPAPIPQPQPLSTPSWSSSLPLSPPPPPPRSPSLLPPACRLHHSPSPPPSPTHTHTPKAPDDEFLVRVSYLEIYNEKIHDLLGEEEVNLGFATAHLHLYSHNRHDSCCPLHLSCLPRECRHHPRRNHTRRDGRPRRARKMTTVATSRFVKTKVFSSSRI